MSNMPLNVNFNATMQSLLDIQSQAKGQTLTRSQQPLQIQSDSERASFQQELQKKQFGNGSVKKNHAPAETSAQKTASSATARSSQQSQASADEPAAVKQETADTAAPAAPSAGAKESGQSASVSVSDAENAAGEEQASQSEEALAMMAVSLPGIILPQVLPDETVELGEAATDSPLVDAELLVSVPTGVELEANQLVLMDDSGDMALQEELPTATLESFASALQETSSVGSHPETQETAASVEDTEVVALQNAAVDMEQTVPTLDSKQQRVRAEAKQPGQVAAENSDALVGEADAAAEADIKLAVPAVEQSEQSSSPLGREVASSLRSTDNQQAAELPVQNQWNFAQIMAEQQIETQVAVSNVVRPSGSTIVSQVDQLLQTMEASHLSLQEGKVTEMEVTLQPRNLGKLVLKLEMENNELRAYFNTQSQIVKQALESQMSDLRDLLQQQGLNVSQLSVQVGSQQQANQSSAQRASKGGGQTGGTGTVNTVEGELPIQRVDELWHRMAGNRLSIRI